MNSALIEDDVEETFAPVRLGGKKKAARLVGGHKKLADARDDYLEQYEEKSSTWYRKKAALDGFVNYHASQGIFFCGGVTRKSCTDQKTHLANTPVARTGRVRTPVTQRDTTVVIKHFLRHCVNFRFGLLADVLYSYKLARFVKASIIVATDIQFQDVLTTVDRYWDPSVNGNIKYLRPGLRRFHSVRMRTILAIQISTALRIGETLSLVLNDYDPSNPSEMWLYVRETKNGLPRDVPVSPELAVQIAAWLKVRPKKSPTDFLFVSDTGGQLGIRACTSQYQGYLDWGRSQGVKLPRLTMHSYRHKAITALCQVSPVHAQVIAGHTNIKTTMGYDHTTSVDARKTHAAVDPWAAAVAKSRGPQQRPRGQKLPK